MNCRRARDLFWTFDEATVADRDRRQVATHRAQCTLCAEYMRDLEQARTWLRELPVAEPPENFDWRLKLRLSKLGDEALPPWRETRRFAWRPSMQFAASAALAATVVLAVGLSVFRSNPQPESGDERPIVQQPAGPVVDFPPGAGFGSRVEPVSSGRPIGPQLPIPNSSLFLTREVEASSPSDSLPPETPDER